MKTMKTKRLMALAALALAAAGAALARTDGAAFESDLPVVYIDTANGRPVRSKKVPLDAAIRIVAPSGAVLYDGAGTVKGRGNSTWHLPKKPYKIKLDKKADLFGFGRNKHWVLLANYLDESLMRNKVAYDLSAKLGLVAMQSAWVDVVLNGVYVGNYQLCEHIRVGSSRIDIFDWDDVIGDADERRLGWLTDDPSRDITGGYLFELSEEFDEVTRFKTATGLKVMVGTPEYLKSNKAMTAYVTDYWRRLEEAWAAPDKRDGSGTPWAELADLDAMAAYWLVQEIMGNVDAVYKSRHAYKDRGGPVVFGPVWDFDWSSASAQVPAAPTGWTVAHSPRVAAFYRFWVADADFRARAVAAYARVRGDLHEMVADGGLLDRHRALILASARRNEALWRYRRGFEADFAAFKGFLAARIQWLDGVMASEAALERAVSPLYGVTAAPSGAFTAAAAKTYAGRALRFGRQVGTVKLTVAKAAGGASRVTGSVTDATGRTRALKAVKVPVGDGPALVLTTTAVEGTKTSAALRLDDNGFAGIVGAYGVESAGDLSPLADGDYRFQLLDAPDAVDGWRIDRTRLPDGEPVAVGGRTWATRKAAAGNAAGLRLSPSLKRGTFSGRFRVYAERGGKIKPFTLKVQGTVLDGRAEGTATNKTLGTFSVRLSR